MKFFTPNVMTENNVSVLSEIIFFEHKCYIRMFLHGTGNEHFIGPFTDTKSAEIVRDSLRDYTESVYEFAHKVGYAFCQGKTRSQLGI